MQSAERTGSHHEHNGIVEAPQTAGEIYADAPTSLVGPNHPDHWEAVPEQYVHDHPNPDNTE